MKKNKTLKRILMGTLGFALAVIVFFTSTMQGVREVEAASTKVFDLITSKYGANGSELKILEVIPDQATVAYPAGGPLGPPASATGGKFNYANNISPRAEMGYFLWRGENWRDGAWQNDNNAPLLLNPSMSTWGTGLNVDEPHNDKTTEYSGLMYNMYQYGMIKQVGQDTGHEFPIYGSTTGNTPVSVYESYSAAGYTAYDGTDAVVRGVYSNQPGEYDFADKEASNGDTVDADGNVTNSDGLVFKYGGYAIDDATGDIYFTESYSLGADSVSENSTVSANSAERPEGLRRGANRTDAYGTYKMDEDTYPETITGDSVVFRFNLVPDNTSKLEIPGMLTFRGKGNTDGKVKFTRTETATSEKTQYLGYSERSLFFNTSENVRFYSSDQFRQYVLGDTEKYHDKVLMYETVASGDLTAKMVEDSDLIYISGKAEEFNNMDISTEAMIALYDKEVNDHKAVMMDYACYSPSLDSNVSCLALLLWQQSQSAVQQEYDSLFEIDENLGTGKLKEQNGAVFDFGSNAITKGLKESMMTGANGNFVVGNVYVYNHHVNDFTNPKSLVDAGDNFANGDFSSAYKSEVESAGFQDVKNYIASTNKASTTSGQMATSVTPAVAIQYILINTGELTVMKQELRILEIEPVVSFLYNEYAGSEEYGYLPNKYQKNRRDFIENYLSDYYKDKTEYIQFVSKTVDEFNGSNEDLIESYDIIFIGSEMGTLYFTGDGNTIDARDTNPSRKWDDTNGYDLTQTQKIELSIFRADTKMAGISDINYRMTGNVYYTQGDTFEHDDERLWGTRDYLVNNTNDNRRAKRFTSRDITRNKLTKLKEYLDAENLIICEKDLMSQVGDSGEEQINPSCIYLDDNAPLRIANTDKKLEDCGRIDNSSNMYELFKYSQGYEFCMDVTSADYGKYIGITDGMGSSREDNIKPNLVSAGDLLTGKTAKTVAEKYVATDKISLTMNKIPMEYGYDTYAATQNRDGNGAGETHFRGTLVADSIKYLEKDSDNNRELVYDFVINSNSTVSDTYTPYLFVDINNDGKFSKETEMITDAQVFVKATGAEADMDITGDHYVLYRDVEYELKRPVDKDYYGFIKWKLYLSSLSDSKIHASVDGSTVAENLGDTVDLKILQLNHNGASTLNLQNELERRNGTGDNRTFMRYLSEIPGYNLYIRTITVQEFENDFNAKYTAAYNAAPAGAKPTVEQYSETYFDEYEFTRTINGATSTKQGCDMLVLGFGDDYANFATDNAMNAVRRFIENGNPTLMTHDFIMFDGNYKQVGYLRDLVGMDKYGNSTLVTDGGVTYNYKTNAGDPNLHDYLRSGLQYTRDDQKNVFAAIESTGRQVAYEPGTLRSRTSRYTYGFTDATFFRYKWGDWFNTHRWHAWLNTPKVYIAQGQGQEGYQNEYYVDQLNSGQITDYPYHISSRYRVANTHFQYFELNLDADDDNDGESDVVVWYTLGDVANTDRHNIFGKDGDYKHASTAYYIYNKGNVTYTGAGHSGLEQTTDEEAMLFVNSLFAALQSKLVAPSAGFYETPVITASPISSLAVPYDGNVTAGTNPDSSIIKGTDGEYKYKFVDPNANAGQVANGTKMFFRMSDANFVRGTKSMEARMYIAVPGMKVGDNFTLTNGASRPVVQVNVNGESVPCVEATDLINVYNVNNGEFGSQIGLLNRTVTDATGRSDTFKVLTGLKSQVTYGFYLPMAYLKDKASFSIILESSSMLTAKSAITGADTTTTMTDSGFNALTVTKADLLDLD